MNLLDLATNAASGGVLGLLGSAITGGISLFQAKNQFKHDEAMGDLELKRIAAQSDAQSKLSADQLKVVMEQGANTAFTASQVGGNPSMSNVPPVIAGILALWRPLLTAVLIAYSLYVYPTSEPATQTFIVQSYVTSGSAAVLWWFGSRQLQRMAPGKAAPAPDSSS
jgi:hypothetical protein